MSSAQAPAANDSFGASAVGPAQRSKRGSGSGEAIAASSLPAVSTAEAVALIARQPAFLELPLQRLCGRCHELATLLDVTPHDACLCLTRLSPEGLTPILETPLSTVRAAWFRLSTVVATLEEDPQHLPPPPPPGQHEPAGSGAPYAAGAAWQGASSTHGSNPYNRLAVPPPRPVLPASTATDATARRMVLLCPELLMLRPAAVRASALHLRSVLDLSASALRRLLERSPRLLLLPPRHRVQALRAITHVLGLSDPWVAARLAAQQPALLRLTPEALRVRVGELCGALGLHPSGVARLCRNQPVLLNMSPAALAEKLRRLEALLGLPDADAARRLVLRQPGVLSLASEAVERKLPQLAAVLGLGGEGDAADGDSGGDVDAGGDGGQEDQRVLVPKGRAKRPTRPDGEAAAAVAAARAAAGLAAAQRLLTEEPTLLTMNVAALPARLTALGEELSASGLCEVRAAVLACPQLLVLKRQALRYRLQELAFGLEAPRDAVRALVRARPQALFASVEVVKEAVEVAKKAGVGRGLRGQRRVAAVLEHLARDPGDWLGEGLSNAFAH